MNTAIVDSVDNGRDLIGDVVAWRACIELDNAGVEPVAMGFGAVPGAKAGAGLAEFAGQPG